MPWSNFKFWSKPVTQKCARCGELLTPVKKGAVRDISVSPEKSSAALCNVCELATLAGITPVLTSAKDEGPDIEKFLEATLQKISLQTDVDRRLFSARCKTFVSSDVEISREARGYDITFYTRLLDNPVQTSKVIDYTVGWIRDNPLNIKPLVTKRNGPQSLSLEGIFVFLFIPASRPLPTDQDIDFMSGQVAGDCSPTSIGWLVCLQPYDTAADNKFFITDTLSGWLSEQVNSESIMVKPREVHTSAGRKLFCLVAYREDGSSAGSHRKGARL